jgi:SnoaL-like domain
MALDAAPAERGDLAVARRHDDPPEPADAVAITNLLQAYALFTDQARRAELAALFLPDASWDGTDLGFGRAQGADAVAAAVLAHVRPDAPMVHLTGPPLLARGGPDGADDPDGVRAVSWCLATRQVPGAPAVVIHAAYLDAVRRTPAGWRFAARRLLLRFRAG